MTPDPEEFSDLPRALVERLAAQDRSVALLTPQVDEAVLGASAAHFASRGARVRKWTRRWAIPAAAAAAVLAVLLIRPLLAPDAWHAGDDVDGSGRVDILDAFALARERAADPARITQREVDALAARIVSLRSPGAV